MTVGSKKEGVGYIIPPRKTRVDVGEIYKTPNGKHVELVQICPHAAMFTYGLQCPYSESMEEASKQARLPVSRCPMAPDDICWTVKEVNYLKDIREARYMDGNYVAINDVVDIKVGYIDGKGLRQQLGERSKFTARIVSFEDSAIVIDLSTELHSNQVDLPYSLITEIKRSEMKC